MFNSWQFAALGVPLAVGVIWSIAAPIWVSLAHPRLSDRNPDHFARLVRFSRMWGFAAAAVGCALAFML